MPDMGTPPIPPRRPTPIPSGVSVDAVDKMLIAISAVADAVQALERKVDEVGVDSRLATYACQEQRKDHAALMSRVDDLFERLQTVERNVRRHDSGFRQTSETDQKHSSELAALVIALDDTRKMAKQALEKIGQVEKDQKEEAAETRAQTPVLARVEEQTKTMALPTKAAAALNLVIGVVYLALEVLKALGKH